MCDTNNKMDFTKGAVIGAALGAALGILYAPKSGSQVRKDLKTKGEKLYDMSIDKVEETIGSVQDIASEVADDVDNKVHEFVRRAKKLTGPAKKDALSKLDEIIDSLEQVERVTKKAAKKVFKGIN